MAKKRRKKKKKKTNPLAASWQYTCAVLAVFHWDRAGRYLTLALAWMVLGTAFAGGFTYLDRYVHQIAHQRDLSLTVGLVDRPVWASNELVEKVCLSTGIHSDDFLLDESLPRTWAANLKANPWVKELRYLRKRYDGRLEIDCDLRLPIASVVKGTKVYYLDAQGVLLPAARLAGDQAHLVRLRGSDFELPKAGRAVSSPALRAGLELLTLIKQVDERLPWQERVWAELAVLDVANFRGRLNNADPHLTLFTTNDTEIRWGAEVGEYLAHYEAPDRIKLRWIYQHKKLHGSLGAYLTIDPRPLRKETADPLRQST